VVKGYTITLTKSRSLLTADVAEAADVVTRSVRVALTGPQLDALIALCFNIGGPRFLSSTVLHRVNAQDFKNVPAAFRLWNKETIDGQLVVNQGLVNRREFEIELWNTPA
jgi:lysozyme